MRRLSLAFAAGLLLCGCGVPRDASNTLNNARGGTLHVGIVANPPWVIDRGSAVDGVEGRLAARLAQGLHARIEWVRLPEFELIHALHERKLQLVIGGFNPQVTWAREVALTRPYYEGADGTPHVLAAPPGENAWLMRVDQELEAGAPAVPGLLAEVSQ